MQCAASCAELQACHQAEIMGLQQAAETLRAEAAARAEAQLTQEAELQKQVQASFEAGVTFARRSPGDSAALETEAAALRQVRQHSISPHYLSYMVICTCLQDACPRDVAS